MRSLLAVIAILPFLSFAAEKAPRVVEWSKGKKYGPDGPWQVRQMPSMNRTRLMNLPLGGISWCGHGSSRQYLE